MVSACGAYPPEEYVFRIGFIATAAFLGLGAYVFRDLIRYQLVQAGITSGISHSTNNVLIYLNWTASFGLAGLASVNEREDDRIHGIMTVIFFLCMLAYQICVCVFLGAHLKKYGLHIIDATSYKLQVGILSALIGVTAVFGVLSGNWGKHALWLAILEWTMIFLIMIWNCSFYKTLNSGFYMSIVKENVSTADRKTVALPSAYA